jgi:hypothetical protein
MGAFTLGIQGEDSDSPGDLRWSGVRLVMGV